MKRVKVIAVLLVVISVFFTACNEPETFETAPIITTQRVTTEAKTYVYSEYKAFNTQMGMTVEETQKALGRAISLYLSEKGIYYFSYKRAGLRFLGDKETFLYFMFDNDYRLCEIQYEGSTKEGFDLKKAIEAYDKDYGKHITYEKQNKNVNYVWYSGGTYILITTTQTDRVAMSFIGENYFKENNKEEYKLFNKK